MSVIMMGKWDGQALSHIHLESKHFDCGRGEIQGLVRQSLLTGGAVEFGKRILKGLRRASSPHFVSHSDF